MLSKEELEEYIEKTGMQSLWQVERDYLQHILLRAIYSKISNGLVFKGGTALQKFGIVDRFSIDLDFTSSLSDDELIGIMAYVSGFLSDLGIKNRYSYASTNEGHGKGFDVSFGIEGPYFVATGSEKAKVTIKLQISKREAVLLGQKTELITPIYKDIPPYIVAAMHMEEVAAEKARAIMTRDKPRDVYDLSILIKKGYNLHEFLVKKKLEGYAEFSVEGFEKAIDRKKELWDSELKNLLYKQRMAANFPGFDDAKSAILGFFKNSISLTVEFDTAGHGILNDRGKTVMAKRLSALNSNIKMAETHAYPPFDASITAFFYSRHEGAYLEIYESGNPLMELPGTIAFPQSSEYLGLSNIEIKKGSDLYFQLFIEKDAKLQGSVYASIILRKK
ncbi:MAG: nucleotidyl transferase AbiEii/AbiGii toxin family protein [Candidatus Micrarchaeales archaeon]|jgi:predicted nucleotidyltransferase component of viral defense system|nr:nucleotidyl transferase AbiEii/AbiGii toxin family protein [Candidatus Micrarchaeales archaeon]